MSPPRQSTVPNLITALSGPLQILESHLLSHQARIENWFRRQWAQTPAPFYTSVDLRNAGFKLAPVDTNLFPAGFNNLNPAFTPLCVQAVQSAIEFLLPTALRILLIPESHTRNINYLESLASLQDILSKAGFEVRLGSLVEGLETPIVAQLPSGRTVRLEPLRRHGNRVAVADFSPCLILLNNDLTGGRPPILEGIEQMVTPPPELGWSNRLKSDHFTQYNEVAMEFARLVNIDPWLIDPLFRNCGEVNFMKSEGTECLADNVDSLLALIKKKYQEYGVDKRPFVIVKADSGTYGMAVMTVHDAQEIRSLNRKKRTRMSSSKGGQAVSKIILQEGVYTCETWNGTAIAEPVVYLIDHFVVGGFYRVHTARGENENLNAPGMRFEHLAFAESCNMPDLHGEPDAEPNRFYAYGVIARLATLAAAKEIWET
ncbi:MAG: glutamate--cysteine ligase [Gammaproteobacteria bacterium]|nr:glutamate--cysteine ligase [Gammaproteobacteria bacterium]